MVFFSVVIEELLFELFNFHSTDSTEDSVRGKMYFWNEGYYEWQAVRGDTSEILKGKCMTRYR